MKEQHILNKELHSVDSPASLPHSSDLTQPPANPNILEGTCSKDANTPHVAGDGKADAPAHTDHTTDAASDSACQADTSRGDATSTTASDKEDVLLPDKIDWKSLLADDGTAGNL